MIDIHCHILPFVDDGPRSWETAERMCAMALQDGIRHIVATPHANPQFEYNREIFSGVLTQLQKRVKGKLKFSLGCDFHLSYENLEALFASPRQFLIEGTRYLLIELNDFGLPPHFEQLLFRMRTELQLWPILTHPERNPILQQSPEYLLPWVEAGCLLQITANSFTGGWGRRAQDLALWLLQRNAVHIVATDAHDLHHRPPVLSKARNRIEELVGQEFAEALVEDNPLAVVEGREIPYAFPLSRARC